MHLPSIAAVMSKMTAIKTYSEMLTHRTFETRFEYLALKGRVGEETFGFERWMNQMFYNSKEWRDLRHHIIARDEGRDLAMEGFDIHAKPLIHHIVPMTSRDIELRNPMVLDPENLILTTHNTHNAIHYGDSSLLALPPVERRPGDTKLW